MEVFGRRFNFKTSTGCMTVQFSPKDIVQSGLCIGCGSCVAQAGPAIAHMAFDSYGQLKPRGASEWIAAPSDSFSRTCPFSPAAPDEDYLSSRFMAPGTPRDRYAGQMVAAYVGHVTAEEHRLNGSSGGMVTWVAAELIRRGLVDGIAHVVAADDPAKQGRFFHYHIARTETEVHQGAKSRYYPVELSRVLDEIRDSPGRYAIVGIPCFIKAIQLLRLKDATFRERIVYTLGLFCGHMKSARFVESFAWQMKVPVGKVSTLDYRHKFPDRPANWYNTKLSLRDGTRVNKDWWHAVDGDWGAGFFMNSACNYCDDVVAETADISFGDAWVEPYASDGKGTNVVVVRSPEINSLLQAAIGAGQLKLKVVDAAFVHQTQAAGFRQRREGLAYRLTLSRTGVKPVKRVLPDAGLISADRKLIYRMRCYISKWSHRVFWLARVLKSPRIYLTWAKAIASVYHGVAYHKGSVRGMLNRFREFGRGIG